MLLTKESVVPYVLGIAAKSNVEKRQVGCVILNHNGQVLGTGYNTLDGLHAEHMAVEDAENAFSPLANVLIGATAYVTHQPCPACAKLLLENGIANVVVVEAFMKFDSDKVRYDLVPPSALNEQAKVFTFGASKYKPNNWQNCDDPDKYIAAMLRHIEQYRAGEKLDSESGLHHLAHAMANISFLIELGYVPSNWSKLDLIMSFKAPDSIPGDQKNQI